MRPVFLFSDEAELRHAAGHPDVACVNLTGSVAAGKALAVEVRCVNQHARAKSSTHPSISCQSGLYIRPLQAGYKKLLFELGGNDPLIVLPDANLADATKQAVDGRFGTAGQRCTAPKRIFVHQQVGTSCWSLLFVMLSGEANSRWFILNSDMVLVRVRCVIHAIFPMPISFIR